MKTLRRPLTVAVVLLLAAVVYAAMHWNAHVAALTLAGGTAAAAFIRLTFPERLVFTARSRAFDVTVLVLLALAVALLAPWGLALMPN